MNNLEMAIELEEEEKSEEEIKKKILSDKKKNDFWNAIPKRGFIRNYFDYASPLTDAPEHFHLFVAITILGAVLGNQLYIKFGHQNIYPNVWAILLAPSSFYRKSTSISLGERVTRILNKDIIYPNEFTKERLLPIMETQPNGIFFWKEFAATLGYFESEYMKGIKEWFTEMYDCPEEWRREIKNEKVTIKMPTPNILAASTIDWFNKKIKGYDLRGGFFSRFIYIPATRRTKETIPIPPPENGDLLFNLSSQWKVIKDVMGEVKTNKILDLYTIWLQKHEREIENHPQVELLSSFYTRLSIYILKFAMIYQVSLLDDISLGLFKERMIIEPEAFYYAYELIELLKKALLYLFEFEINTNDGWYSKRKQAYLRMIRRNNGRIRRRTLQQNSNDVAKQFKDILSSMEEEGLIIEDEGDIVLVKNY